MAKMLRPTSSIRDRLNRLRQTAPLRARSGRLRFAPCGPRPACSDMQDIDDEPLDALPAPNIDMKTVIREELEKRISMASLRPTIVYRQTADGTIVMGNDPFSGHGVLIFHREDENVWDVALPASWAEPEEELHHATLDSAKSFVERVFEGYRHRRYAL